MFAHQRRRGALNTAEFRSHNPTGQFTANLQRPKALESMCLETYTYYTPESYISKKKKKSRTRGGPKKSNLVLLAKTRNESR
jgi:hypothetical protein